MRYLFMGDEVSLLHKTKIFLEREDLERGIVISYLFFIDELNFLKDCSTFGICVPEGGS